jgi:hypothetical protein
MVTKKTLLNGYSTIVRHSPRETGPAVEGRAKHWENIPGIEPPELL